MTNPTIERQTKAYVYELNNCANEYGFKADGWRLCMASNSEMQRLEKMYYPTYALKVPPELLSGILNRVNESLGTVSSEVEKTLPAGSSLTYLVAFNPERVR